MDIMVTRRLAFTVGEKTFTTQGPKDGVKPAPDWIKDDPFFTTNVANGIVTVVSDRPYEESVEVVADPQDEIQALKDRVAALETTLQAFIDTHAYAPVEAQAIDSTPVGEVSIDDPHAVETVEPLPPETAPVTPTGLETPTE